MQKKENVLKTPRRKEYYKISDALEFSNNTQFQNNWDVRDIIVKRLKINLSSFLSPENEEENTRNFYQNFKQKLKLLEDIWYAKEVNPEYEIEFNRMKEHNHFSNNRQIENEATTSLQKQFSFDTIFANCDSVKAGIIKNKILDLYNFAVNSQIFPRNILCHTLYPFTYQEYGEFSSIAVTSAAYGKIPFIKKSAMMGINFSPNWFLENAYLDFQDGYFCSDDISHTFIHEFAHVICYFYNLSPDYLEVLNKKITDSNQTNETIVDKIEHHFNANFGIIWKRVSHSMLVKKAVNFIIKKIIKKEDRNKEIWKTVAKLIAVPSTYGRTKVKTQFIYKYEFHPETEWFAEGFAYYFLTPPHEREKYWNIWHEFFTTQINFNQTPNPQ